VGKEPGEFLNRGKVGTKRSANSAALVRLALLVILALPLLRAEEKTPRIREVGNPQERQAFYLATPLLPATALFSAKGDTPAFSLKAGRGEEDPSSGPGLGKRRFWRALAESAAYVAYFQARYKKTHRIWVEGVHKYRATWEDQKEKYLHRENWNYDANCFAFNWQHALAGGIYYNWSRTNNLTALESLLMSWASSTYWEAVVEYRSDISLNDHIVTPLGGLSVGEAWFQLGNFFANRSDLFSRVLSFVNPILKLNRFFDRRRLKKSPAPPPPGWHDLSLDLGMRSYRGNRGGDDGIFPYAGLRTQIIHLPDYGRPGKIDRFVKNPFFSEIHMDVAWGGKAPEEISLYTRVVFLGWFKQRILPAGRGYSLYIGLGSAFSMFKKKEGTISFPCTFKGRDPDALRLDEPRDFRDKLSAVHMAGPVLDFTVFARKLKVRMIMDGYLDFGIVNSFAFNQYSRHNDFSGVKTPLLVNGYYYALGFTLTQRFDVHYGGVGLQSLLRFHSYGSIDGADRFQPMVTDDFHLTDSWLTGRMGISFQIPKSTLRLKASFEAIHRRGRIRDIREKQWELRGFLGISLVY
jgi:hypothetical protein